MLEPSLLWKLDAAGRRKEPARTGAFIFCFCFFFSCCCQVPQISSFCAARASNRFHTCQPSPSLVFSAPIPLHAVLFPSDLWISHIAGPVSTSRPSSTTPRPLVPSSRRRGPHCCPLPFSLPPRDELPAHSAAAAAAAAAVWFSESAASTCAVQTSLQRALHPPSRQPAGHSPPLSPPPGGAGGAGQHQRPSRGFIGPRREPARPGTGWSGNWAAARCRPNAARGLQSSHDTDSSLNVVKPARSLLEPARFVRAPSGRLPCFVQLRRAATSAALGQREPSSLVSLSPACPRPDRLLLQLVQLAQLVQLSPLPLRLAGSRRRRVWPASASAAVASAASRCSSSSTPSQRTQRTHRVQLAPPPLHFTNSIAALLVLLDCRPVVRVCALRRAAQVSQSVRPSVRPSVCLSVCCQPIHALPSVPLLTVRRACCVFPFCWLLADPASPLLSSPLLSSPSFLSFSSPLLFLFSPPPLSSALLPSAAVSPAVCPLFFFFWAGPFCSPRS